MLDKKIFGEVPEVVHSSVVYTLDLIERDRHETKRNWSRNRIRLPRAAVACLAVLVVSGLTVSAMGVMSLYRQRMEEMNGEMLEAYYQIADAGEATSFSRSYTNEEKVRYEELSNAYENEGVFPESQVTYLESAEDYKGQGIGLDAAGRTLYLPEETLSDEELLQIIDFNHKVSYSIYEQNEERIVSGSDWQSRLAEMDDQAVDEVYLTMFSGNSEISGAYNRELSEPEKVRYEELVKCYEDEGAFAQEALPVIQTAEEYTGEGAAICVENSTFYLPDSELTDEELLQVIDLEHKAVYCLDKVNQEIDLGLRDGYPQIEK